MLHINVFRPLTWLTYGKVRHRQREKHSPSKVYKKEGIQRYMLNVFLDETTKNRPVPSV